MLKAFWGISAQNKCTLFSQAKTFVFGLKERPDIVYFYQIEPDPRNAFGHREKKGTLTKSLRNSNLSKFGIAGLLPIHGTINEYLNSVFTPAR